ncbi:HPP family protein [Kitasatospora herbaricolor]|uniref:HPP family protein n=1 Tax=Kitasatospora herbaricolor TaxID=68217 RepID=A0ABZ1W363_9ACTN|nr:HPP family protein [Kitasatospora herbaricolor]
MIRRFLARFELSAVMERHDPSRVLASYSAVNAGISLAVMAAPAHFSSAPFLFPSLGPTAFLLFFALAVTGLLDTPPNLNDITWARLGASAVALGLTCGLMPLFGVAHPPAAATTLIVALGLLRTPLQPTVVMIAVVLLVAQGLVVNRLAGIPYPWWRPAPPAVPKPVPAAGGVRGGGS